MPLYLCSERKWLAFLISNSSKINITRKNIPFDRFVNGPYVIVSLISRI